MFDPLIPDPTPGLCHAESSTLIRDARALLNELAEYKYVYMERPGLEAAANRLAETLRHVTPEPTVRQRQIDDPPPADPYEWAKAGDVYETETGGHRYIAVGRRDGRGEPLFVSAECPIELMSEFEVPADGIEVRWGELKRVDDEMTAEELCAGSCPKCGGGGGCDGHWCPSCNGSGKAKAEKGDPRDW